MSEFFDKDYFENGFITKKSCYEHYRWMPELTYPLAYSILNYLKIKNSDHVLEFGCAHGYLVKALNDFNINTYGVDISQYAVSNCPKDIVDKISLLEKSSDLTSVLNNFRIKTFEFGIAKDVFEHISLAELGVILNQLSFKVINLLVVVPLGDSGIYRIPEYHLDPSHIIAEDETWWKNLFESNGFELVEFKHNIRGIKDRWLKASDTGNGFFLIKSRGIL